MEKSTKGNPVLAINVVGYCFQKRIIPGWVFYSDALNRITSSLIIEDQLLEE